MLFSSAVFQFFKAKISQHLSHSTLLDYSVCFARFLAYGGDVILAEVSPSIVRSFLGSITLSKKTVLNHHIALSSLWTFALGEGYCLTHVIRLVRPPKPQKHAILEYSKGELALLFRASATGRFRLRDYAILCVLYDTGLRANELCTLRVRDISGSGLVVWGKGDKQRVLPVSDHTAVAVRDYLVSRGLLVGADRVFVARGGSPMHRDGLRLMLRRLGGRARVPNVHPHRFRHSFALEFLRRGGNVYALKEILGHSTLMMALTYLALVQADLQNAHKLASPVAAFFLSPQGSHP